MLVNQLAYEQGYSIASLARAAGIHSQTLYIKHRPHPQTVKLVADVLNVDVTALAVFQDGRLHWRQNDGP